MKTQDFIHLSVKHTKSLRPMILLAAVLFAAQLPASQILHVNKNDPSAFNTIQAAIDAALPGDTIEIAGGGYVENLVIGKDLVILGAGAYVNGGGAGRVILVQPACNVRIEYLSIANGYTSQDPGGAGILNYGTLQLYHVHVEFNQLGSGNGSGIHNQGTMEVVSCTISDNTLSSGSGSGIYNLGTMEVVSCMFEHNTIGSGSGAGIANSGQMTIDHSWFWSNRILRGGGSGVQNSGTLDIISTQISGNTTEGGTGAGIASSGPMTIDQSDISYNEANYGGGIAAGGQTLIKNSTIRGNSAASGDGGGIIGGSITLINCTISGNTTYNGNGGGLAGGNILLKNCTVTGNSAVNPFGGFAKGGGIYSAGYNNNPGLIQMFSTILAGNLAEGAGPDCLGPIESLGFNLIGDATGIQITSAQGDHIGFHRRIDPRLGPLQNNGGPTPTHALLPNSPAIDTGSSGGLTTDQTGNPRIVDFSFKPNASDGCDIGAFEAPTAIAPPPGPLFRVAQDGSGDFDKIQDAIDNASPGYGILVAPGTYKESLVIDKDLVLEGQIESAVIIDAGGDSTAGIPAGRAVAVDPGCNVRISKFIIQNANTGDYPGGAGVLNDGTLSLKLCSIRNNVFHYYTGDAPDVGGGGIYNGGTMDIVSCNIYGNEPGGGGGGGILNRGVMTIDKSAIFDNRSVLGGGGLLATGQTLIRDSTFSGNSGFDGAGGIQNAFPLRLGTTPPQETVGPMTLINCTISGNAGAYGAGITAINITMKNCTVTGQIDGVGIFSLGNVKIFSTIVAGNSLDLDQWDLNLPIDSLGFNVIGNGPGAVINALPTDLIGTSSSPIDPLLGPLQDNGGPTLTHALLPGSPAIDRGHSGGLTADQTGAPRIVDIPSLPNAGDGCDVGAFEAAFVPNTPPVITCPADMNVSNDPGQCSAVVNYPAPLVSGGTGNIDVVCNPPSGSVFPVGTTAVTCTATDAAGNSATCSFNVTVNDAEPPVASYAVVKAPAFFTNPPRIVGGFQLLATDNCDPDPLIYLKGNAGSFVAGPFHNGDQVEIAHGPSLIPQQAPSTFGGNIATIQLNGDVLLWAVDSSGNASTPIKCK